MKPYPKYKPSGIEWIGNIPEPWLIRQIKREFTILNGSTPKSSVLEYWNGDINWFTPDDLGKLNNIIIYESNRKITQQGFDNCGVKLAPPLSIAMSTRAPIGHLAILGNVGCVNQGCRLLIPSKGNTYYFYYLLLTAKQEIVSNGQGTTFQELAHAKLSSILIPIPPVEEQNVIANFLDKKTHQIDALITQKQKLIDLLQQEKTAVINEAVTKGLNPDVKMKDSSISWLGEIPKHWTVTKLGYSSTIKARLGWKGLKASEYVESGYIFLSTPNIKGKEIDFENVYYINEDRYFESPEIMLEKGNVLLVKDGSTLGIVNVIRKLPAPATVNSSIAVIKCHGELDPVYLFYYLQSSFIQNHIQLMKGGMGVPHLFQADIKKFVLTVPPKDEQESISHHLDEELARIEGIQNKINIEIDLLQEYRFSLINEAVTGKIDVREYNVTV